MTYFSRSLPLKICSIAVVILAITILGFTKYTPNYFSDKNPIPYRKSTPENPTDGKITDANIFDGHSVLKDLSPDPNIVEVELTASPEQIELKPGEVTDTYAYNGRIPGPLLEVSEGDSVIIHFRNELEEETTVHWHGLHLPFISDGSPFHPVDAGESYTYRFRIHESTAGTYWYHPHPHHRTAWQVGMGLYGGIIVRDPDDPLPEMKEKMLILSDNRFNEDGSLDFPEEGSRQFKVDEMNGREGDVLFVNDEIMPNISIRSGEIQRWRIVNASGARIYRLALEGHSFIHAGSDGGLFEHPKEVDEVVLANGERAEILVRGTGEPGSKATFQTLPYDRYMPMWRPNGWNKPRDLLTLHYTDEPPMNPIELPDTFRSIPKLDADEVTVTRKMRMNNGKINGKTMDLNRVDETAELGATEIWEIENVVGMDHPFHLHGFQFQVIERNDKPVSQPKWEDTVNIPGFEKAKFIVKFEDYPGKWMFHCHILDHEDQGMMGVLEVK